MILKSLTVGGFKNLGPTKISFDHNIVAVISPNNYGKSNLLEALNFATDFIVAGTKQRINMMGWSSGIPLTPFLANEPFQFQMEFEAPDLGDYRFVRYGFSFMWYRDDQTGRRIVDETIEMRQTESVRYSSYLKRKQGQYRKGKTTNAFRNISLDDAVLAIDVLPSVEDLEYKSVLQAVRSFGFRVCDTLDVKNQFQFTPFRIGDEDDKHIHFDDEDVPRALYQLKELYPDQYWQFEDAIHTLFPEFSEIHIHAHELSVSPDQVTHIFARRNSAENSGEPPVDEEIPFHLKDKVYRITIKSDYLNQPVNLATMSTGTKRIFWLLTNIFVASCNHVSCVGVEELETSIHPKMLKNLLEIISDTIESTQIIISSHSPYLVQYLKPEQLYAGASGYEGVAQFYPIAKTKVKKLLTAARSYGLSVGEYLFELMSGGDMSLITLRNYLEGF